MPASSFAPNEAALTAVSTSGIAGGGIVGVGGVGGSPAPGLKHHRSSGSAQSVSHSHTAQPSLYHSVTGRGNTAMKESTASLPLAVGATSSQGHTGNGQQQQQEQQQQQQQQQQAPPHQELLLSQPGSLNISSTYISSIVNRLIKKLPLNSGISILHLEEDTLIRHCVASLVALSQTQLPAILKELAAALESLNKSATQVHEEQISVTLLQSRLFILRIMSACMIFHWRCCEETSQSPVRPSGCPRGGAADPLLPLARRDPTPLDDFLAKSVLSVMTVALRQTVAREDRQMNIWAGLASSSTSTSVKSPKGDIPHSSRPGQQDRSGREWDQANGQGGIKSSLWWDESKEDDSDGVPIHALSIFNGFSLFVIRPGFRPGLAAFEVPSPQDPSLGGPERPQRFKPMDFTGHVDRPEQAPTESVRSLTKAVYRYSSLVIYYLSSSNWNVVQARIRNRLLYLAKTAEEVPDTSELRLIECSNLDSTRLSAVLSEMNGAFPQLKRSVQSNVALVLRRTVWSFIQFHPAEFATLYATKRGIDGNPDLLFDYAHGLAETHRKKQALWPMMTALLILSPDVVSRTVSTETSGAARKGGLTNSMSKKLAFFEALRKALRSGKLGDVAALCSIDICRAASATSPTKDISGLRLLATELEGDLRDRLFDPHRSLSIPQSKQTDPSLITESFIAFFRLDPRKASAFIIPNCVADASPLGFKIGFVRAVTFMVREASSVFWHTRIETVYPLISAWTRIVFKNMLHQLLSEIEPIVGSTGNGPRGTDRQRILKGVAGVTGGRGAGKEGKVLSDDVDDRLQLLKAILLLWKSDLRAASCTIPLHHPTHLSALSDTSQEEASFDPDQFLSSATQADSVLGLIYCIGRATYATSCWDLHEVALAVLACLIPSDQGPGGKTHEHHQTFVLHARRALVSLGAQKRRKYTTLFITSPDVRRQRHWLAVVKRSLELELNSVRVWARMTPEARAETPRPSFSEYTLERATLVQALLLAICSVDCDVPVIALRLVPTCIQLAEEAIKRGDRAFTVDPEWIQALVALSEPSLLIAGRVARQRRIRSVFRGFNTLGLPLLISWEILIERWQSSTKVVARMRSEGAGDPQDENMANQWLHYAGFLCALSGSCLTDPPSGAVLAFPADCTDAAPALPKDPVRSVQLFIEEMVALLTHESYWVRDRIKDMIGLDLDVRANGLLLARFHTVLDGFFDRDTGLPTPTATYTMFVEHSISVASAVITRQVSATRSTTSVDIGALMVLYVEYVNALGNKELALRIKAAVCQLCVIFMAKKTFFAFPNELRLRNRLVQTLIAWTSDAPLEDANASRIERLQKDLDIACLHTISVLLDGLPLLLGEGALVLDDRIDWAKSRHFALYLDYFTKILHRTRQVEPSALMAEGLVGKTQAAQWLVREQPPTKENTTLRDYTILSLTHLLASNIDSGLQHSLVLGYSEDLELRSCFIQIMTNVLNQGAAFEDFERTKQSRKESRLVDLVGDTDLCLALAICEGTRFLDPESGMDKILLSIFDTRGGIVKFLKAAIEVEIGRTSTEEMVFRSNTNRTHLLSLFARTHAYEYLRTLLTPLIAEIANKGPGFSCEIEPDKLQPGESAAVNQTHLEEITQIFIDTICESAPQVPAVLRELSRHIRVTMDAKFPNSRYQGVGGFMFLRLLGPAIVAPENIDWKFSGPNSKDLRRTLLLVSKILQTLASNSKFSAQKSPLMAALNDFLSRNVWKVAGFLDGVSDARTDPDRLLAADQPLGYGIQPGGYGLSEAEQQLLHKYLYDNADKIGAHLLTQGDDSALSPPLMTNSSLATDNGEITSKTEPEPTYASLPERMSPPRSPAYQTYERLCQALADLGPPISKESEAELSSISTARSGVSSGRPRRAGSISSVKGAPAKSDQLFQDFLRRAGPRSGKDVEFKNIFFAGPHSRSGRTVFYFNPTKQDSDSMDPESLVAYVLKILEGFKGPEFDVVVDVTGLKAVNLFAPRWALYAGSLLSEETAAKARHVMFFNWNTTASAYIALLTRLPNLWPPSWKAFVATAPQISHFTALSEFDAFIERRNLALSAETVAITTAIPEHRFNSVTMVWYYRNMIPVTFRIGGDHLQITSLKTSDTVSGFSNDIFHLADIDDVRSVSTRGDDSTFFLTCRGGEVSFIFNSRERVAIVQALREARARTARIKTSKTAERTLLPSDVPGRLLNLAMLNMMSENPSLRLSAYNLLCALSTSFNFGASSARKKLLSSLRLALPANTLFFVSELSKELAATAPGVTLEFFTSFFEGFESATLEQKTKSLRYMTPWLSNLVMFTHTNREQQPEYAKRIKETFANLLSITIRQAAAFASMQQTVWSQVGKLDDLIPVLLDVFTEMAIDSGLYTPKFDAIVDTMVSFSSINLRGKLLARLRRTIVKTAHSPDLQRIYENPLWKEIATLARMNMALSFTSGRVEALCYLPDILHVVLLLAGVGCNATRYTVRGTVINFVHSLCTEDLHDSSNDNSVQIGKRSQELVSTTSNGLYEGIPNKSGLEALLARLTSDECSELFGLPSNGVVNESNVASNRTIGPSPDNDQILKLANLIHEIEDLAAPSIDAVNSWRARLASLTTSKAFQYNPVIQSRAFLLLGCMAHGEIDDDLLYQILVSLRGAIHEWANKGNPATVISIVTCLSKVVRVLPEQSRYLAEMFWLGISIIQFGSVAMFSAGIELLHATVVTIQRRQPGEDLIGLLMEARGYVEEAAGRLDTETGVNFDVSFSFSLATLVLKGLRHPSTKDRTNALLRCILEGCSSAADESGQSTSGRILADQLGIFLALLPSATRPEALGELLALAGLPADDCEEAVGARRKGAGGQEGLLKYLDIGDNRTYLLSLALVAALLRTADDDTERLTFYTFLAEAGQEQPSILSILYDHLSPGMQVTLANAQSAQILEAVQTIAEIAIFEPVFAAQVAETGARGGPSAYLAETGFPGLLDCATFDANYQQRDRRLVLAVLATALLSGFIDGSGTLH